jgi:hypothetical protein
VEGVTLTDLGERVQLHVTNRGDRFLSLIGVGYGVVAGVVGALFAVAAGRPTAVSLVLWVSGGFFFLVGLIVLVGTLRPSLIAFDDRGLSVRSGGHVFEGPWDDVDAIGISTVPKQSENDQERHNLVLWVPPHVKMRRPASYPVWSVHKGHVLVELSNLKETPDEVAALLRRYAKDKFRVRA